MHHRNMCSNDPVSSISNITCGMLAIEVDLGHSDVYQCTTRKTKTKTSHCSATRRNTSMANYLTPRTRHVT